MQLAALIAAWPMKILSREYVFAAWTAAAVLILSGCSESQTTSAANNERQAPITVSVILEPAYQPQLIQAAGSVAASARIEAASRLAAYIEEIPVKEGDLLQKGDVLFKLDSKDVLAAIHAADGKLKAAQAALKDAELDREKIDALYREGLVSNNDWRKATLKRDGARADLAQAQGFASAAHGELEYIIGKSPREGRAVRVLRRAGDMAVPGLPIVVLDSEEAPKFEFRVPQSAAQYAKPGVIGRVKLDGINEPLEVVIENASASADPLARTYFVRAGFKALASREAASVRPGMFGRIEITAGKASRRFVPESALTRLGGLAGAFVLQTCRHADAGQNQCAYFHWLRLGTRENGLAEVLAGLEDLGNSPVRFVDRPKHQLTDGDRVTEADSRVQTGDQQ